MQDDQKVTLVEEINSSQKWHTFENKIDLTHTSMNVARMICSEDGYNVKQKKYKSWTVKL